ncbi:hypothetical protein F4604DRAFT_1593925 [Suillus subluteus]|nr:hypothetical protein F4604DRAFT_1593925 [Suillus subluteus]
MFSTSTPINSSSYYHESLPTSSNSLAAQDMFQLREINQIEREMCQYLERGHGQEGFHSIWSEDMVKKDFVGQGPYPTYILPSSSKTTPPPTTNPFLPPQ